MSDLVAEEERKLDVRSDGGLSGARTTRSSARWKESVEPVVLNFLTRTVVFGPDQFVPLRNTNFPCCWIVCQSVNEMYPVLALYTRLSTVVRVPMVRVGPQGLREGVTFDGSLVPFDIVCTQIQAHTTT